MTEAQKRIERQKKAGCESLKRHEGWQGKRAPKGWGYQEKSKNYKP